MKDILVFTNIVIGVMAGILAFNLIQLTVAGTKACNAIAKYFGADNRNYNVIMKRGEE